MTPYPVTQAYKSVVDAEQETPDDFEKDHELHFSAVQKEKTDKLKKFIFYLLLLTSSSSALS
jgi:hypothetical protein